MQMAVKAPTVYQSKLSLGFVLALIALKGRAGLAEFAEDNVLSRADDKAIKLAEYAGGATQDEMR